MFTILRLCHGSLFCWWLKWHIGWIWSLYYHCGKDDAGHEECQVVSTVGSNNLKRFLPICTSLLQIVKICHVTHPLASVCLYDINAFLFLLSKNCLHPFRCLDSIINVSKSHGSAAIINFPCRFVSFIEIKYPSGGMYKGFIIRINSSGISNLQIKFETFCDCSSFEVSQSHHC